MNSAFKPLPRKLFALALSAAIPTLTGCALGHFGPGQTSVTPGVAVTGTAHGGQQPINGAHVYLFEAGVSGGSSYVAAPTSLLTSASGTTANPAVADIDGNYYVPTTASGAYTITGHYTCAAADTTGIQPQVYILAIGGDPQIGGSANSYISLVAAFGDCNTLTTSTVLDLNEITTAATATALQQFANFATGYTATPVGFSTSSTNTRGLKQAFATANNLYDISTAGARLTIPTTGGSVGTAPFKLLVDFGNVLSYCVNSDPASDNSHCSNLSTQATGSSTPIVDTLTDAIEMALNPSRNVATLWGYVSGTSPFGAQLSAAPNDWTLGIDYTVPAMYQPSSIAIDTVGNIWTNNTYVSGTSTNNISEIDNAGNVLSGTTGFTGAGTNLSKPTNLAFDKEGNLWVTSDGTNDMVKFTSAGSYVNKFTGGGQNATNAIAVDANDSVWDTGFTSSTIDNTLSKYVQGTTNAFSSTTTLSGSANTYGVRAMAFNTSGDLWTANSQTSTVGGLGNTITELDSTGALLAGPFNTYYTGSTTYTQNPYSIAIDKQGFVWVADAGAGSVSEFNTTGTLIAPNSTATTGYRNSLFTTTRGIVVDGDGNIWVVNYSGGASVNGTTGAITTTSNVAKLAGSQATTPGAILSGTNSYKSDQQELDKPAGLAIDNSGNVWIPCIGTTVHPTGSIVELVGAAAPVITPLVSALSQSKLGTRP